ncbi:TAXI family TRAP transporter solute-binding subunit [Candidatus Uabimicrobium sp. HlEnr_7]|uniref:TAXI family TRAP transporter solute-binding subunit n=1 Tax=Candidatus Uabimicrobium helgolandensis TaxID=3095367 RepID=UPI00355647E2
MQKTKQFIYKIRFILYILLIIFVWQSLKLLSPPLPKKITIASGNSSGAYYKFAHKYKRYFAKQGIELKILETAGSVENFQLLENNKADIAFIQGGTTNGKTENITSIMSVYYEPLWVFLRQDLKAQSLVELKGMKIGIGQPRSGTQFVANQLLKINDITPQNSQLKEVGFAKAAEMLQQKKLDAAFFISSPKSSVIQQLFTKSDISLMSFRRYRAYARNFLFIKDINIYEGMLNLTKNIPAKDKVIISTVATIATNKNIHPAVVQLLLQTANKIHSKRSILEESQEFPSLQYLELPAHESAQRYFQNGPNFLYTYLPFWLANLLYRLALFLFSMLTIIIPLSKIIPALIAWRTNRKIGLWYKKLLRMKLEAENSKNKKKLKAEITELKKNIEESNVPIMFKKDFYTLQLHIYLLEEQINGKKNQHGIV